MNSAAIQIARRLPYLVDRFRVDAERGRVDLIPHRRYRVQVAWDVNSTERIGQVGKPGDRQHGGNATRGSGRSTRRRLAPRRPSGENPLGEEVAARHRRRSRLRRVRARGRARELGRRAASLLRRHPSERRHTRFTHLGVGRAVLHRSSTDQPGLGLALGPGRLGRGSVIYTGAPIAAVVELSRNTRRLSKRQSGPAGQRHGGGLGNRMPIRTQDLPVHGGQSAPPYSRSDPGPVADETAGGRAHVRCRCE